jgi:hypothetical protein
MPESVAGIALIQLRPDLLAAALADAVRRAGDLPLIEPAPAGPDMLDRLTDAADQNPLVVLVGEEHALDTRTNAFGQARPDLMVVTVPVGVGRPNLALAEPALDELIGLLRWLVHGGAEARLAIGSPKNYALLTSPHPALFSAPDEGDPGNLVQLWLDAVLRLALAQAGTPDEASLPGLTVSAATVRRLLARQSLVDQDEIAALKVERDRTADLLAAAFADGEQEFRLGRLVRRLALDTVEWQTLLLLLAPELDPLYQRVYGVLHDDLGCRTATLGLVGALLFPPGGSGAELRAALSEGGALARWWLSEPRLGPSVSAADPIQVDPAIRTWLFEGGVPPEDPRLAGWLRYTPWPGVPAVHDLPETARLVDALRRDSGWVVLTGGSAEDWRATIEAAAHDAERRLLRVTPMRGGSEPPPVEEISVRVARAALLYDLVPALTAETEAEQPALATLVGHLAAAKLPGPAVLVAPEGPLAGLLASETDTVLSFAPIPTRARAAVFRAEAERANFSLSDEAATMIAATSRLPVASIASAMALARAKAAGEPGGDPACEVASAARQIATPCLPHHARLVVPAFDLDQVVLPPDRQAQLHEIVSQCRHSGMVLDDWGFGAQLPTGRSVAALFWGPSGTGKTMAAQAVARALATDLYVVDLARVVSKYIGETEKNLDAVFGEAERAGVVLLFDEADALFAKRGEVRDANDRYANIEVAYLLQRLETFAGLAILTSNFRQNIDTAFFRRLRFSIEFPRPDIRAREAIWRQCLPASAPVACDLDFGTLARRIELTGGNIRQITLRAAYAAAEARSVITMTQLLAAARAELVKIGMPAAANALPVSPAQRDTVKADAA